jgi:hypothetical protein
MRFRRSERSERKDQDEGRNGAVRHRTSFRNPPEPGELLGIVPSIATVTRVLA